MRKETIAVDIDDVLAANAKGFIAYSNKRWGTTLTANDYGEDLRALWGVTHEEAERRANEFHASGAVGTYHHDQTALATLQYLRQEYRLITVTSRRLLSEQTTKAWLETHFAGVFEAVHFAGFWEAGTKDAQRLTKAEILEELGVDYLIDDQFKHCAAFAASGKAALLFGNYTWNRTEENLPAGVTRVHKWLDVKDYFDGIRR